MRIYEFSAKGYIPKIGENLIQIGLGVTLWDGVFEGKKQRWLRWCDNNGELILTGAEQSELERQKAEQERQRADKEKQRADEAEKKTKLAEKDGAYTKALETARKMLAKGYDPDEICELTGLSADQIQAHL